MALTQDLTRLKLPADYIKTRQHIFPSVTSLKWFIRQHRSQIHDARAMSRPLGRDLIDEVKFDEVVIAVGLASLGSS